MQLPFTVEQFFEVILPTFGLPCPTTLFTIGLLAFVVSPYPRSTLVARSCGASSALKLQSFLACTRTSGSSLPAFLAWCYSQEDRTWLM